MRMEKYWPIFLLICYRFNKKCRKWYKKQYRAVEIGCYILLLETILVSVVLSCAHHHLINGTVFDLHWIGLIVERSLSFILWGLVIIFFVEFDKRPFRYYVLYTPCYTTAYPYYIFSSIWRAPKVYYIKNMQTVHPPRRRVDLIPIIPECIRRCVLKIFNISQKLLSNISVVSDNFSGNVLILTTPDVSGETV